jgi:hypothetical protein
MKISASIVIYNENKDTLGKVINSFISIKNTEKELIIVDNSPKEKLKSFCERFDFIRYIFSGQNLGFGSGHNLAYKSLTEKSDIHMILNPDIYFDSEEILAFLNWLNDAKKISLATTKVCYPDGTFQNIVRDIPSILSLLKRKLKISSGEINIEDNTVSEIPFAHGCFMIFKSDIFEKLNGFDERFFMYMEDIDMFIRAKAFGKTVINTNYRIYHEYRKSSSKNFKLMYIHLLSALKFFLKYKNTDFNKINKIK